MSKKRGGSNGIPQDRGCSYAPSCLTCPFVQCRYDLGANESVQYRPGHVPVRGDDLDDLANRNLAILSRARNEKVGIDSLALEFNLSRRQVFRVLRLGPVA